MLLGALGVIGDLLDAQRTLSQRTFERVRRIELQLGIEPSHYEPERRRPRPRPDLSATPTRPGPQGARGMTDLRGQPSHRRQPDRGPDRQHLRQVRLDQPGGPPADGRVRAHARPACSRAPTQVGARRRLRRGGPDLPLGRAAGRQAGRGDRSGRSEARGGVAHPPAREPRVPRRWPAERLPVPRPRVRPGRRDRGARARARPRAGPLAEMARVSARHLLVSVPREPLWRALNVARGAYLRDLGNTPGHVNHWSKRGFVAAARGATARWSRRARRSRGRCCWCVSRDGRRRPAESAADRHGAAAGSRAGHASANGARREPDEALLCLRRPGPVDRDRLDRHLHLPVPGHGQPRARPGVLQPHLAVLGDHVRDPVGDLPAGRAAALADDRRPPGARAARPSAADPGDDPVRVRARCS